MLVRRPAQVKVHAEMRAYVSAHGFWKQGTPAMFDIRIINLNVCSYLRMTQGKALAKAEKKNNDLYLQACLERRHSLLQWYTLQTLFL